MKFICNIYVSMKSIEWCKHLIRMVFFLVGKTIAIGKVLKLVPEKD